MSAILLKLVKRLPTSPLSAFTCAFAVRIAVILLVGHYRDAQTLENGLIATQILNGEGFATRWGYAPEPTSMQAPLYPYMLAAAWRLFGSKPLAHFFISIVSAAVESSMVFPMFALTRRWFGSPAAIIAMWISAVSPMYLWYPTRIHHTALLIGAHPWILYGWLRVAGDGSAPQERRGSTPGWLSALAVGTGTGVVALIEPVILPIYGVLGVGLLAVRLRRRLGVSAVRLSIAGMATVLVLAPWTIRNYMVHKRFVPVKSGFGKELWMGNNPNATGTTYAEGGEVEITIAFPPRALLLRGKVPEIEIIDAFAEEAWAYIRADPLAFVGRTMKKALWFWTTPPPRVARSFGRATPFFRGIMIAYWAIFVTLAAVAIAGAGAPREYRTVLLLFVAVPGLVYGITHVGQPRFRSAIEFIVIPATSAGLLWLLARMNRAPSSS